jgi:hypothetical protein
MSVPPQEYVHTFIVARAEMMDNGWQVAHDATSLGIAIPPVEHHLKPGDVLTIWTATPSSLGGLNLAVSINGAPPVPYPEM